MNESALQAWNLVYWSCWLVDQESLLVEEKGYLYESRFQFFTKKAAKIACNRLKKYDRDCFIRG